MYRYILLLGACLLSQVLAGQSPDAERDWDDLVAELRSLDCVSGFAVGYAGAPGEFFMLSKPIIRAGAEEGFRRLLTDEHAVVRCMGLLALAQ